jgi:hypothetical protein
MANAKQPHLTPRSLVGQRFASDVFDGIKVALIGYCPPPAALDRYQPKRVEDQHFIHVSQDSVRILTLDVEHHDLAGQLQRVEAFAAFGQHRAESVLSDGAPGPGAIASGITPHWIALNAAATEQPREHGHG